jgi:L-aminopeptidase/D-esterase-like protein
MERIDITDIPGFRIGHEQNINAATGCTVIICQKGAVAGVDVRGGSPGTRDTDALDPVNNRKETHAVILSGGSSFGLDAAGGVMRFLEERGIGRDVGVTCVPNVCGAILFDLKCGDYKVRPDAEMGYRACLNAGSLPLAQGSVGAGTGATIGKASGLTNAMKGGIGACAFRQGKLLVGAVIAVNCVGDIYDSQAGRIIAGVLNSDKRTLGNSEEIILSNHENMADLFSGNTVIGCVITNAKLDKAQANKLASVSHNGIARAVRPAHSVFDGDTIFTMCTGETQANFDAVGILAAYATEQAILNAIKNSDSLCGYPAYRDL